LAIATGPSTFLEHPNRNSAFGQRFIFFDEDVSFNRRMATALLLREGSAKRGTLEEWPVQSSSSLLSRNQILIVF
jgi:hypothetical protein